MRSQKKEPKAKEIEFAERFEKGLKLLRVLSNQDTSIVVEGIKDITALRGLGLTGPIHTLAGHNVVSLADELASVGPLLILFDFDRRGEQLARQLATQLEGRGVTILHKERSQLRRAFCWRVRVIEGLKQSADTSKGTKF